MPDVDALVEGVLAGRRAAVSQAITLVESSLPAHRSQARELYAGLERGPAHPGAVRVGISGVPGVGKSTFIETLGTMLTSEGHRVGVLAVDPSSTRTGGSVLGDKTRMAKLSADPHAYIRPSPSAGTLGGVARATVQAMTVLEAAGYDVVLVETVGVGQSETAVAGMVDCFFVLMLARTGDSLQGMKKGVLEIADVLAVNKADGDHLRDAKRAARELADVLRLLQPAHPLWHPPVLTCSGLSGDGLPEVWAQITEHRRRMSEAGEFDERRRRQQVSWMWAMVDDQLRRTLHEHPAVRATAPGLEADVRNGTITATLAAQQVLATFWQ